MPRTSDARDRLVRTAMDLLSSRSYSEVGVQELCDCAGVRKGSFYHFFPSKRDLALEALDEQWQLFREHLLEPAFRRDVPPLQRIERLFDLAYAVQKQQQAEGGCMRGCPFGSLAAEVATQDEVLRAKVEEIMEGSTRYLRLALEEAGEAGVPLADPPEALARSLMAYMQGTMLLAKCHNDPEILRQLGPRALRLVTAGTA